MDATQPDGAKYSHEQNLRIKLMLARKEKENAPRVNLREERSVTALIAAFTALSLVGACVAAAWAMGR